MVVFCVCVFWVLLAVCFVSILYFVVGIILVCFAAFLVCFLVFGDVYRGWSCCVTIWRCYEAVFLIRCSSMSWGVLRCLETSSAGSVAVGGGFDPSGGWVVVDGDWFPSLVVLRSCWLTMGRPPWFSLIAGWQWEDPTRSSSHLLTKPIFVSWYWVLLSGLHHFCCSRVDPVHSISTLFSRGFTSWPSTTIICLSWILRNILVSLLLCLWWGPDH